MLNEITGRVSAGSTFHAAAAAFPQVFEFQWLEAIRTGEVTGKMAQVLDRAQQADSRIPRDQAQGQRVLSCIP